MENMEYEIIAFDNGVEVSVELFGNSVSFTITAYGDFDSTKATFDDLVTHFRDLKAKE